MIGDYLVLSLKNEYNVSTQTLPSVHRCDSHGSRHDRWSGVLDIAESCSQFLNKIEFGRGCAFRNVREHRFDFLGGNPDGLAQFNGQVKIVLDSVYPIFEALAFLKGESSRPLLNDIDRLQY